MTHTESTLTDKCEDAAALLKSLSNPDRLRLLCGLWDGEKSVSQLESYAGISQSLVSQFLNRMRLEGIVSKRKTGKSVFYSIKDQKTLVLMKQLHQLFCGETYDI